MSLAVTDELTASVLPLLRIPPPGVNHGQRLFISPRPVSVVDLSPALVRGNLDAPGFRACFGAEQSVDTRGDEARAGSASEAETTVNSDTSIEIFRCPDFSVPG